MLSSERHEKILEWIERDGRVLTPALARLLHVSDETVRADLDKLAQAGRLRRVHGGATGGGDLRYDLPLPERTALHPREKAMVARAAVKLIAPRDTVFFDASSTVLTMTRHLSDQPITVLTNAHHVVVALGGKPQCDLICTGGNYEERSRSYVGPGAEEALRRFVIRWMFLGVDGFDPERGASELNPGQAVLKERIIANAEKVCIVTDHTKLGRTSPFLFARCAQIDVLVTDTRADPELLRRFEQAGIAVMVADEDGR